MKTGVWKSSISLILCIVMAVSILSAGTMAMDLSSASVVGVTREEATQEEPVATDVPEVTATAVDLPMPTEMFVPALEERAVVPVLDGATSGTCGTNLTWTLVDGVLTISGTGAMKDYAYIGDAPWYTSRSSITSIVILSGVTSIGKNAFYYCRNFTSISIPATVLSIGDSAFTVCSALATVNYGGREADWNSISIGSYNTNLTDANVVYAIASGTCGTNLTWTLVDGVLTIFGNGAMTEFSNVGDAPWYSERNSITSVVIKPGVTSIGKNAFYYCSAMTSITIPASVTFSGYQAFTNCTKLEAVYIEDMAAWCAITFKDKGSSPVGYAEKLYLNGQHVTNLQIPAGVTSIGDYAFTDCRSITSVSIPSSVTSIGKYAFYSCVSLTSVTIPGSVVSVGHRAFNSCSKLESVILSDGVESIGSSAFVACSKLKEITIPASVTDIGASAFSECSSLTTVNYGGSESDWENVNIGDGNDYLTGADFTYAVLNTSGSCGENLSWRFEDGVLTISGTGVMAAYSDTYFAPWYDYRESITSVVIESGVTSIGGAAFLDCYSMTSVIIPDSITSIGGFAFSNCDSLTSMTIGDGVKSIGASAFRYCDSLTSVTILDGVTSIGEDAFYYCSSLTSVTMCSSVTSIGGGAFYNCTKLTSINIPDSVESIGFSAFRNCSSLESVTIPDGVKNIGSYTFCGCISLTRATIPDSVTSIGDLAFYSCSALEHILYIGTEDDWTDISIGTENTALTNSARCFGEVGDTFTTEEDCVSTYTKCPVCEDHFAAVTKEGGAHSFGNWVETTAATCTEDGSKRRDCENCDHYETGVITAPGHTEVVDKAVAPTCTGTGLTEGSHCSVCDETLVAQETVDALGHDWSDWAQTKAPTIAEEGEEQRSCSVCQATESRVVEKLTYIKGDVNEDGEITIADAVRIARYDAGYIDLTESQLAAADTNGDGEVTIADAVRIARYDAGYIGVL